MLKLSALLGALLIAAGSAHSVPNLVQNGDFSNATAPNTGVFPSGSFQIRAPSYTGGNSAVLPNWTATNTGCVSDCTNQGNYSILWHPITTNSNPAAGSLYGVTYTNSGSGTGGQTAFEPSTRWNPSNTGGTELLSQGCGTDGSCSGDTPFALSTIQTIQGNTLGGGNFVGLDGDSQARGTLQQTINGLTVNHWYRLDFQWAATQLQNKIGTITERLEVGFGSGGSACAESATGQVASGAGTNIQCTATLTQATHTFSGWQNVTMFFKAGAVSQTLYFLSRGGPGGQPPVALLDGISLVDTPEPGTFGILATGLLLGFMVVRHRRSSSSRMTSAA